MPSLDTSNNRHPLAGDFTMYYRGTYMSKRDATGRLWVMFVRDVMSRDGDGLSLEDLSFYGEVFDEKGSYVDDGNQQHWEAEDVSFTLPRMGYRMVGTKPVYFTSSVNNRTQKKGLHIDNVLSFPRISLNRPAIYALLDDKKFEGRIGRDMVLYKGNVLWRGDEIGTFIEGALTLKKTYEHVREFVCKLLERSSEVKSVVITDQ